MISSYGTTNALSSEVVLSKNITVTCAFKYQMAWSIHSWCSSFTEVIETQLAVLYWEDEEELHA